MKTLAYSEVPRTPKYIHLAYVSAETGVLFLLGTGVVVGVIVLLGAAFSAWRNRKTKPGAPENAAPAPRQEDPKP